MIRSKIFIFWCRVFPRGISIVQEPRACCKGEREEEKYDESLRRRDDDENSTEWVEFPYTIMGFNN